MNKGISAGIKYGSIVVLSAVLACIGTNIFCEKSGKTGVLDNEKVLMTAEPFQAILGEESRYLNAIKARQAEDEKMLQGELTALQEKIKKSGKPENAFQKEINAFRQKVVFYNQKYQAQRNLVAAASQSARQQLDPFVRAVLDEMGKAGYEIILPKQNVMYASPVADITADFVERLNAKEVKITFPDPMQFAVMNTNGGQAKAGEAVAKPAEQVKTDVAVKTATPAKEDEEKTNKK